jgi:acyl carrier protein
MKTEEAVTWIAEVFEEAAGRISPQTLRKEIPGWDSLGTLSLIAGLDEKFDIQLSEKEIGSLESVNDIVDLLRRNGAVED